MNRYLLALFTTIVLTLTGCAGSGSTQSTTQPAASYLYTSADNSATASCTCTVNSYPVASTGTSVAATNTATLPAGQTGYGLRGDGKGNLYALGYMHPGIAVNVYSTASGVLTPVRSFSSTYAGIPESFAVDPTGIVYISMNNYSLLTFAANATGAATPTVTSLSYPAFSAMATDAAGDLYAVPISSDQIVELLSGFTNGTPARTLSYTVVGSTGISAFYDLAIDSSGNIYVAGYSGSGPFLGEYSSAAGTTDPIKTISGSSTTLVDPVAIAVDAAGTIYEEDAPAGGPDYISTFSATVSGNVAPTGHFETATSTIAPAGFVGLVAY